MKMWITSYALTKGIFESDGEIVGDGEYFKGKNIDGSDSLFVRISKDAHETREDAVTRAETIRTKKIASLHKQIERITNLNF